MDPIPHQRVLAVVYAIHDFQAENPDELSFSAGEAIQVTEKDDLYGDGWWQGRNSSGDFGLFPQAYTLPTPPIPPSSASISQSGLTQPTMNETLFEVQNAIDQLHLPSPSTSSFPHQASASNSPGPSSLTHLKHDDDDQDSSLSKSTPAWDQNSNPTKARALLAEKAKADAHSRLTVMERLKSASNQLYSNNRASVNSSISIPDIGEIELSEESGGEDEHHQNFFAGSPFDSQPKNKPPSRPSTAGAPNRLGSLDQANPASQVRRQSSDLSSPLPFKPGPFSAAAMALGLTTQSKDSPGSKSATTTRDDPDLKRPHHAHKLSSGSVLSDIGLDLREHFNGPPAPLASTLRMSRESSQMTQPYPTQTLDPLDKPVSSLTSTDSAQDDKTLRPPASFPTRLPALNTKHFQAIGGSHSRPSPVPEAQSPQEHLSPRPASRMASDGNLKIADSFAHSRQCSSSSVGSSVFMRQQLSSPVPASQPAPVPFHGMVTSASTADSSSHKGSRSRSSSRVGPFAMAEDQLTSPATSTFPSLSGVKPGGESSSSHGAQNKQAGYGIKSTVEPPNWGVSDVVEWAKAKGLDEFTVSKFGEHEITGDVLLELEMNSLKEIDLVAFGRRVKVIKAIEDLKKAIQIQKQGHHHLPLSPNYDSLNANMLIESPVLGHFHNQPGTSSSYATRAEPGDPHGRSLSAVSRQESVQYRSQGYQPMGGEVSDREEELTGGHRSQKSGSNRFSPLHQGHSSKPSDASGLSYPRRAENEVIGGSHREDHQISPIQHESQGRASSTIGRPRQATFSASRESVQMMNQQPHNRSKSTSGEVSPEQNNHNSRGSSWAPLSIEESVDEAEKRDSFAPLGELEEPPDSAKSSKRGKKKKLMGPKTPNSVPSKKTVGLDSPTAAGVGAGEMGSPEEAQGKPTRTSFLGNLRNRKPPPKMSGSFGLATIGSSNNGTSENERPSTSSGVPGSMNGRMSRGLFHFGGGGGAGQVQGQNQHQIQHLTPVPEAKVSISSPISLEDGGGGTELGLGGLMAMKKEGESRSALERIGKPDHQGWMRKKGEKYMTWKLRYFILKGANLYYLKSQNETRIKGLIKLGGFKVVMDADVHPGRYGFRIIHDNGSTHSFSADDSKLLREWMKAMMKATIDRDWVAPVISSCNIRTIPIRDAQKMFPPPRPPSPTSRQRMQKARLAANGEMLTEKDAAVLMSMQTFTGPNGRAVGSPPTSPNVVGGGGGNGNSRGSRWAGQRASGATDGSGSDLTSFRPSTADEELLNWVNRHLRSMNCNYQAQDFSKSMKNGLVVVRLVEKLSQTRSGLEDGRFERGGGGGDGVPRRGSLHGAVEGVDDDEFEVYFCVFDYLNSQKIPLEGYSLNDMISGDPFKTRDFLMRIYRKYEV